ncbi:MULTISPECIES: trigger factor [Terrabacteria group]|uniref:trigger factor n=1 Tax=Bacillati TaxID=1783272 RepID=UPI001C6F2635|nr:MULTISPECIES: trigger factor [Terrabacteria group]MBW9211786.1 trigger factor [Trueperella sp. zg.1013]
MTNWILKEKSTGDLSVVVEGEVWQKAIKKAFNKLVSNITLPGFRKGQAPKVMLEKKISENERYLEAVQSNANEWLKKALEETKLTPISQPQLDIKSMDSEKAEVVYTFAVQPEAKVKSYKGLDYPLEEVSVSEKEIKAELDRMREQYAELEIKKGKATKGNTVNIDYEGFKDGLAFEGGKADSYDLVLGSGSFIPGFEDQLIGMKAGEEKDVELSFPEDYHVADLAGAPVVFKVKVNEVKVKKLPEVNDDFAQDINAPGVENVEQLHKMIEDRLTSSKKSAADEKAETALMDALISNTEVELPDIMVDDEVQNQVNQLTQQIQQYGMSLTSYLQMMGQTSESLKEGYRANATKTVTLRLALEAVAKAENLTPSDEEIEKEYASIASQYNMEVDQVKAMISKEMLSRDVVNKKAYDFVKENAKKVAPKTKKASSKVKSTKKSVEKE